MVEHGWVIFVTEAKHGWAYTYKGWESLSERNLCGPMDLLVWGTTPGKSCYSGVEKAASLLQRGAMRDARSTTQARNLMMSREHVYHLHYNLILTYDSGTWATYMVQSCVNYERNVNGMSSIWSGDISKTVAEEMTEKKLV